MCSAEEKYLKKVILSSDVYVACLQHALTTEKQEIMGLLIGQVNEETCISEISACMVLHRSDKQPDRVEISPEQLSTAAIYADALATKLKKPMRVLGWYHSHPHITVWPSHVDCNTQALYQTMDDLFVGLIFSVYQNNAHTAGNYIQLTCFQATKLPSDSGTRERVEIPLEIRRTPLRKNNLESIANLPNILFHEEMLSRIQMDADKDVLAKLHNDALETMVLVHIVSKITKPLCEDLDARLKTITLRIAELEKLKKELQ